jgi:hypothetical protein
MRRNVAAIGTSFCSGSASWSITVIALSKAYCLLQLEHWDCGFESLSVREVCVFLCCDVLCRYRPHDESIPQPRNFTRCLLAACFIHFSSFAYASILKTEVICSPETTVYFHRNTRCYIPEGRALQTPITKMKLNSVALVREQIIPTEQPQLFGEVSANFCG